MDDHRNDTGATLSDKNLHAFVSPALLQKMQQAAHEEHLTVDEFVADAIERRLNRRELDELLAFGKRHALARGLAPRDVGPAIAAERRRSKEHGR